MIRSNIQKEIADAGYRTVELFAHENGLDKSTLSRVLNGSREPRIGTLIRIANALGIPLTQLVEFRPPHLLAAEKPRKPYR
jgi:gp16 family phage-associated protein